MSKITAKFEQLKKEGRSALIPYITAGFPSLPTSQRLIRLLAEEGADIIEIGIPYSDPLADGLTIQRASMAALSQGVNTRQIIEMVRELRKEIETPLVLMTYYNTIYRYGQAEFARDAASAGVDGVIAPDLPPEEAESWQKIAQENSLDPIFLLAPTSSEERIEKVALSSRGFIYCVSLTGVTGARETLPSHLSDFVSRVRAKTEKPLAVGFGVSRPEQAREVARIADGVIIGSAIIDLIEKGKTEEEQIANVREFIREILKAIKSAG